MKEININDNPEKLKKIPLESDKYFSKNKYTFWTKDRLEKAKKLNHKFLNNFTEEELNLVGGGPSEEFLKIYPRYVFFDFNNGSPFWNAGEID